MAENEKICREKIRELMDVVLDINSVHERRQERTGGLPTMFLHFSGHIGYVYVNIYLNGWDDDADPDCRISARTDSAEELTAVIAGIRAITGGRAE